MGCCCSNDSDSEMGIDKSPKNSSKHEESYENPLLYGRERPPTYGATEQRRGEGLISSDIESDSIYVTCPTEPDTTTVHTSHVKSETTSRKGKKKVKKRLKKIFRNKGGQKSSIQTVESSEKTYEPSKTTSSVLTHQDISNIRQLEKQKKAQARAKDLEAKITSEAVLDALQKANERGERLNKLQDTTAELRENSESFAENARRIAEREKQRYLSKKTKKHKT